MIWSAGSVVALGLLGLVVVIAAAVAEILSPGWAVLAVAATVAIIAAAAGSMAVVVRAGARRLAVAQGRELDRRLAAHGRTIERTLDQRLAEQSKASSRDLDRRFVRQERLLRADVGDVYTQLEALTALYRRLEPDRPLPPLRRWALSPDLALHLVGSVLDGGTRTILETGSGSSTVVFAMALEKVGAGRVVALEHEARYAEATRTMLDERGLSAWAEVVDAPLTPVDVDGEEYLWYDLDGVDLPSDVELLLVDGPPEATGHHARYPALPLLRSTLATNASVVLDDGDRVGETEVAGRWAQLEGVGPPKVLAVERNALELVVQQRVPD